MADRDLSRYRIMASYVLTNYDCLVCRYVVSVGSVLHWFRRYNNYSTGIGLRDPLHWFYTVYIVHSTSRSLSAHSPFLTLPQHDAYSPWDVLQSIRANGGHYLSQSLADAGTRVAVSHQHSCPAPTSDWRIYPALRTCRRHGHRTSRPSVLRAGPGRHFRETKAGREAGREGASGPIGLRKVALRRGAQPIFVIRRRSEAGPRSVCVVDLGQPFKFKVMLGSGGPFGRRGLDLPQWRLESIDKAALGCLCVTCR